MRHDCKGRSLANVGARNMTTHGYNNGFIYI